MKKYCFMLFLFFILAGCNNSPPDNVVAIINGKHITLHMVNSFQDLDFTDINNTNTPTFERLRSQYGVTLSTIILYEIVLQHLEKKGIIVTDEQVANYEKELLEGYPAGEFEKYITENSIDLGAWRTLLRYQLTLDLFKEKILFAQLVPSAEEVEKFYLAHSNDFILPESFSLKVVLSEKAENLEELNSVESLLNLEPDVELYATVMQASTMPKEYSKDILALTVGNCTKILKQGEDFTRICLEAKNAKKHILISEAYAYIEKQLMDIQSAKLMQDWLEQNLQDVDIKVSEHLLNDIS